jgi:hypothetical protein
VFHTVVALEHGTCTVWQAQLLAWSFLRAGERGPLTLIEAGGIDKFDHGDVFEIPNYRHPSPNDDYPRADPGDDHPVFNRLYGLRDWLEADGPRAEAVLMVDADTVWFDRLGFGKVRPGFPVSQNWWDNPYMAEFCSSNGAQAIGVPLLMHLDDLRRFVPRAIERMHAVHDTPTMVNRWMDEMGGFALAASCLDMEFSLLDFDDGSGAILHYYSNRLGITAEGFDKGTYHPWDSVVIKGPPASKRLCRLVNEYVASRRG